MRLASLKIAGFKSFADPVQLAFPDALTAIVGPNGCGKSNVMDAIRWVLGESSARQLRGEAMSDVIFAGAGSRSALGQASVELVFANTLGQLGGAYNAYTELSVRRLVTREGGSSYFLNGRRCRRKDIQEIFLGTGLGPRSYAVIQQGMINRIVEARPDELRVFIEEAAGVSRYQSRRHETLQHLEHAVQNLSRLDDLRAEQEGQLRQLRRQSQAAERYRLLQAEQQQCQLACWSAQWQGLQQQLDQQLAQLQAQGEQRLAIHLQREAWRTDMDIASARLEQLLEEAAPAQRHWQQLEQQALTQELAVQQQQQQLSRWAQQQQALIEEQQAEAQQQQTQQDSLTALGTQIIQLTHEQSQTGLWATQDSTHQQQRHVLDNEREQLQRLSQQLAQGQQRRQAEQQQMLQLQRSWDRLGQQQATLEQQRAQLQRQQDQTALLTLQRHHQDQQQAVEGLQAELASLASLLEQGQHTTETLQQAQNAQQAQQLSIRLQQQALQQLIDQQPVWPDGCLAEQLQWQQPVDPALMDWMDRIYAPWLRLVAVVQSEGESDGVGAETSTKTSDPSGFGTGNLAQPIRWPAGVQPLSQWIRQPALSLWQQVGVCWTAVEPVQLQAWRDELPVGASLLYCPQGPEASWLGRDWHWQLPVTPAAHTTSFAENSSETVLPAGVLGQRERQQVLMQQGGQIAAQLETTQQQLSEAQALHQQRLQQQRLQQQTLQRQQRELQDSALELSRLETRQQVQHQQAQQLQDQQRLLEQQQQDLALERDDLGISLARLELQERRTQQQLDSQQQAFLPRWQAWQQADQQREQARQAQEQQREILREAQHRQHWLERELERLQSRQRLREDQLQSLIGQQTQGAQHLTDLQQLAQQQRELADMAQQQATQRQQALDHTRKQLEQLRQHGEKLSQQDADQRTQTEQLKLAWQANQTRQEQLELQMQAAQVQRLTDVQPDQGEREQRLAELTSQLARMGELNLAAPAELAALEQRHEELVQQQADIQASITQLQQAIGEIDQETQQLFMQTFTQVNAGLQQLFPQVFGGGEAQLSLEDGWQSGVRLMARPPGKRNSSLALLSGGEKALTALALIFAIFKLNPAPFCLLDEVDAPLDDANVQRFCQLVTELSRDVQFIYISHNKLAMRMAQQLIGVTMPDAGISRTVRVNLEQAAQWGAA